MPVIKRGRVRKILKSEAAIYATTAIKFNHLALTLFLRENTNSVIQVELTNICETLDTLILALDKASPKKLEINAICKSLQLLLPGSKDFIHACSNISIDSTSLNDLLSGLARMVKGITSIDLSNQNPHYIFQHSVFKKKDSLHLNDIESKAFAKAADTLKPYGVTEKKLHTAYQPCYTTGQTTPLFFTSQHADLLISFVKKHNLTPAQAIQEINLLKLSQIVALEKGYAYGLRGDHLRSLKSSTTHANAILHLIKEQDKSIEEAIDLISGKTKDEVEQIIRSYAASSSRPA